MKNEMAQQGKQNRVGAREGLACRPYSKTGFSD